MAFLKDTRETIGGVRGQTKTGDKGYKKEEENMLSIPLAAEVW